MAKNMLLFIGFLLLYSKKKLVYVRRFLFLSLFLIWNLKLSKQAIFGKLLLLAFLCIFSFENWISDEKVMSFFLGLNMHIHALLFLPFPYFFYFWKTPLTLYPFKFLPPLILDIFTYCLFLNILASNVFAIVFSYEQKLTLHYKAIYLLSMCSALRSDDSKHDHVVQSDIFFTEICASMCMCMKLYPILKRGIVVLSDQVRAGWKPLKSRVAV